MTNHPNRSKQPKWRPIETAPKDGSLIQTAEPRPAQSGGGWEILTCWWDKNFEAGDWDDAAGNTIYRGAWNAGRVASWNYQEYQEEKPTHWMPLPSPPTITP